MHPEEMTEAERELLRDGLRILARMIARRQLSQETTTQESSAPASAGEESSAVETERTMT